MVIWIYSSTVYPTDFRYSITKNIIVCYLWRCVLVCVFNINSGWGQQRPTITNRITHYPVTSWDWDLTSVTMRRPALPTTRLKTTLDVRRPSVQTVVNLPSLSTGRRAGLTMKLTCRSLPAQLSSSRRWLSGAMGDRTQRKSSVGHCICGCRRSGPFWLGRSCFDAKILFLQD